MALVLGFVALIVLDPPLGAIALGLGLIIEVGELIFWNRFLRRYRIQTGAEGLIGKRGVAVEACEPLGRVRVHGELWRARCETASRIAVDAEVEVTAVEGLELVVEPTGRQGR
jgi:membrane-bound serine protease (ClpP class)